MLGLAFNAATYHRRLNVLTAIMTNKKKAKTMLKAQAKLLENSDSEKQKISTGCH